MNKLWQFSGIFVGALYGLLLRLIWGRDTFLLDASILSITFLYVTPMLLAICPVLFTRTALYKSTAKQMTYPMITVVLFLSIAVATRLEDLFCILVIGIPFILIAALTGLLLGIFMKNRMQKKGLLCLLFTPFILQPIENLIPHQPQTYHIDSSISIAQTAEHIYPKVLEVPYIHPHEYKSGFFQAIGIPRPIYSQIIQDGTTRYRIGKFTDDLLLREHITAEIPGTFVNFKIDLENSQLRDRPTDRHVMREDYFRFDNISYTLTPLTTGHTRVQLHCSYTLNSKLNFYANFWAKHIIKDFEERLLQTLKLKIEQTNNPIPSTQLFEMLAMRISNGKVL